MCINYWYVNNPLHSTYLVTDKVKKFYTVAAEMKLHMPLQLHQSGYIAMLKLPQVFVTWQLHALRADFVCKKKKIK